jgi:hypothetical protein
MLKRPDFRNQALFLLQYIKFVVRTVFLRKKLILIQKSTQTAYTIKLAFFLPHLYVTLQLRYY